MQSTQPLIFLSYAKEDRRRVVSIYRALRNAGLRPWMDTPPRPWQWEGIAPGQDWDSEIRRRMNEAAVVLIFLSRTSVAKRGYVQREYRLALNLAAERPSASISVIPVLLDKCEVPDFRVDTVSLRQFHWHARFRSTIADLVGVVSASVRRSQPTSPVRPRANIVARGESQRVLETLASEVALGMLPEGIDLVQPFAGPLSRCLLALSRGDHDRLSDVLWRSGIPDVDLNKGTVALGKLDDPKLAGCVAALLAHRCQRQPPDSVQRKILSSWLDHKVAEVGAVAAMVLAHTTRTNSPFLKQLERYARSRDRVRGFHMVLRHFMSPDLLPRLAEIAPSLTWEVFANDPHLAGMEMRHVSMRHPHWRTSYLINSRDWRMREIGSAVWTADDRVSVEKKLELLNDPEPRVRFRSLQGILHTEHDQKLTLVVDALFASPSVNAERRSFSVFGSEDRSCVAVHLNDRSAGRRDSSSSWATSGNYVLVEAADMLNLGLRAIAILGSRDDNKVKPLLSSHFGADIPRWVLDCPGGDRWG